MNIALDFDDTYTACPEFWGGVLRLADECGDIRFYVVTSRPDTPESRETVAVPGVPPHRHLFTGHSPKRWFCEQREIRIDVWIDDLPESVTVGR